MFGLIAKAMSWGVKGLAALGVGIGVSTIAPEGTKKVLNKAAEVLTEPWKIVETNLNTNNMREEALKTKMGIEKYQSEKSADINLQEQTLRMQAQKDALQGRIDKGNFWTGTFGSIIAAIVNAIAPNSTFSQYINAQVADAAAVQAEVKNLINSEKVQTQTQETPTITETTKVAPQRQEYTKVPTGEAPLASNADDINTGNQKPAYATVKPKTMAPTPGADNFLDTPALKLGA